MSLVSTFRSSVFSTGAAATYTCAPTYTPAANSLLIVFEENSLAASPLEPTGVTGHGVTFTKLTLASRLLSTTHSLSVWVANAGASPSNVAVVASFNSISQTGCSLIEFEVTGWAAASAVAAIVQNPVNSPGTSNTSGSVTLAAAGSPTNRPLSFFVHLANEATSPRANWTETAGADGNFNTPATGAEGQFRSDAFETTASASWVGTVLWMGIALEVMAENFGTLSKTQDAQTISAAGTIPINGDLSKTQAAQTISSTGTVDVQGVLTKTQADQTIAAAGTVGASEVIGTLAVTQGSQTLVSAGTIPIAGSAPITQAPQTISSAGTLPVVGDSSKTQANQSISAAGTLPVVGVSTPAQAGQALSSFGVIPTVGSLSRTQAGHTLTSSGYVGTPPPSAAHGGAGDEGIDNEQMGGGIYAFV